MKLIPPVWQGRRDGPGDLHRRWHTTVRTGPGERAECSGPGLGVVGFASDEGVRRNFGRPGAAEGPRALRAALSSLALHTDPDVVDIGDVMVVDGDLEGGQTRLGTAVAGLLRAGRTPLVLGGGHETAYGSYLGIRDSGALSGRRLGILNLDAHFDLREAPKPTSGTPFRQIAEDMASRGEEFHYAVAGIASSSNTAALFETADRLGVGYLLDEECQERHLSGVRGFVEQLLADVDVLYLTVDLDVLPAAVAPGVSAPAALGMPAAVVLEVCRMAAASGKLLVADVTELNPAHDIDQRTARIAARVIHTVATNCPTAPRLGGPEPRTPTERSCT